MTTHIDGSVDLELRAPADQHWTSTHLELLKTVLDGLEQTETGDYGGFHLALDRLEIVQRNGNSLERSDHTDDLVLGYAVRGRDGWGWEPLPTVVPASEDE